MLLADFRSKAIVIDKDTEHYDVSAFQEDLLDKEYKAKLCVWLNAIIAKTAGFVPLQFPSDQNSNSLWPALPSYIQSKTDKVLKKYSEDLAKQTKWAKDAISTIVENSTDHLPKCELDPTNSVIQEIVGNLEELESEIGGKRTLNVKTGSIKQFWSRFKALIEPLEDKWNKAAGKQFDRIERVSAVPCLLLNIARPHILQQKHDYCRIRYS